MSQIILNEKLLSNKKKLEVLKNTDLSKIIDSYLNCKLCKDFSDKPLERGICIDCKYEMLSNYNSYGNFNIRYKF